MPRWKALPEELDPRIREFAEQLRRLVDRSGLSLAAVADRTGYGKTSWERYLDGRLLAPKGAILALAEVTDTGQAHLITMWELAERAWSRSEMRHDLTMDEQRIAEARAALGEYGPPPEYGPAPEDAVPPGARASAPGTGAGARAPRRGQYPAPPGSHPPGDVRPGPSGGRRKVVLFLAGVVGALLVIAAAVLLTDLGGSGGDGGTAAGKPSATPTTSAPPLPAGVKCSGAACTGQDPETMGCGGEFATTASSATIGGSLVEVRYSKTCQAAWARITRATAGDTVRITVAGKAAQQGLVDEDTDAYTPMTAVAGAADARACATLTSGATGCTGGQ
ncbi:XRE family transcriptional regulator [Streptomyces sp. NBC_00467]|uniref:XRE family transcriptional regulator n=1 Tax=Streptomyces sp. NBC_00467 TaxID=2975752 RepID=UPI002E196F38